MTYALRYHEHVVRDDIPKLSALWRERVRGAIESKLTLDPDIYGKPLRRSLKGYRKLRVGDWRVIFRIDGHIIFIILIAHRSIVYRLAARRRDA